MKIALGLALGVCIVTAVATARAAETTTAEARAIAKEAYTYGYPMVDSYRILHAYFVDQKSPEYKGPWNVIRNVPRVFTPEDKAVQTPNSDTPYSTVGMDLRSEPIVLTVPPIEKGRYFSIQLIDLYTHNFGYIGSRATGNEGGIFLIAGPNWKGRPPQGVSLIRSETDWVLAVYRTQLFSPSDLDNVKKIQARYKAELLSTFLGQPALPAAPTIDFIKPLTPATQKASLEFFNILNFTLQFCPTNPSEAELFARFARIGVGSGKTFGASKLSHDTKEAIEAGMADAWAEQAALKKRIDARELTSGDLFGTREDLKNNYAYRMAGAIIGIYANSKAEAMYPAYTVDAGGQALDAATYRYTLRFEPGRLPPVNAFWSLTMYELPSSLLTANQLNRYLLNSPMLPAMKSDADGGLTLYIQHESPDTDKEANWLPAPNGPFFMALRLYWPKEEALNGKWTAPALKRIQ